MDSTGAPDAQCWYEVKVTFQFGFNNILVAAKLTLKAKPIGKGYQPPSAWGDGNLLAAALGLTALKLFNGVAFHSLSLTEIRTG